MRPEFDPTVYRPRLPEDRRRFGIAFIGCGSVVRKWHLPHYQANGLHVVGLWDRDATAIECTLKQHADLRAYESIEALLDDPAIAVVDIATTVTGRAQLIRQALFAGKHVLAQKPLCRNAEELIWLREAVAAAPKVQLAVNFNGRWAPPWRVSTELIRNGAIGEIIAITHLHDFSMSWQPDIERHGSPLFLLFDYMIHWADISLTWLANPRSVKVWAHVVTREEPAPERLTSQVAWLNFTSDDGTSVTITSVAAARRYSGHPFIVHGTRGTLRGAVDSPVSGDYVEIDDGNVVERPTLEGNWFPDGFVGSMGELLLALEEEREPEHGFRCAAQTQELILTACKSAESGGRPFELNLL
jgi:predicted dehydrogenase